MDQEDTAEAFQQLGLRAAEKLWGPEAIEAAMKEMKQLHQRDAFEVLCADHISQEMKRKALESLIFIKEKRDKSLKGRAFADGRKQREEMEPGRRVRKPNSSISQSH